MLKGKYIVIEGIEGSGKTTICNVIKKLLCKRNINNVINVREPGSTPLAEKIRLLVKNSINNEKIFCETELLLFYAARLQLIKNVVQPELKKGKWIISDRHSLSSFAYQGSKGRIQQDTIVLLQNLFFKHFNPNITFYLDVEPKIGLNRIKNRKKIDRIEKNHIIFFENVRNKYLKLIKNQPKIIKINSNLNLEEFKKICKIEFMSWLKKERI